MATKIEPFLKEVEGHLDKLALLPAVTESLEL